MVINLKTLKKTWNLLVKAGLVTFIWAVMFISAVAIFSLVNKNTIYYGNRCSSSINEKAIDYLNQDEIIAYDYELDCNTLYLDINVEDDINKEKIIALLTRISTYYSSINMNINTQATVKNNRYLILASLINDGSVSLSVSEL